MDFSQSIEMFNWPIIKEKKYICSNHKIFQKYSSPPYQKYTFELLETLCKNSPYENKQKIFHKSINFLLKFLFKSKNNILISNYDLLILISFYLAIKTCENQKKIPKLKKLKSIYKEKFGKLENNDIKIAEIIFLKLLDYNINFMTAYDYLCYLFQNKQEFIELPRNNLEIIIKENILEYCCKNPISIIHECIEKAEKNKALQFPFIIKRKLIHSQLQHKNSLYFDFPNNNVINTNTNTNNIIDININRSPKNKDESLSTSLSSGYYNNNHSNEGNNININNYNANNNSNKNLERNKPLKNIICRNIDLYIEKSPEQKKINNKYNYIYNNNDRFSLSKINNSIITNPDNCDENYTYNKKIPLNLKNITQKKEKKIYSKILMLKANKSIREKRLLRNDNSNIRLRLNYTNNFEDSIDDSNNYFGKSIMTKPYIKKEQSKGCFTSYKKREFDIKFSCYNGMTNRNSKNEDLYRCSLKKRLFFGENNES